MSSKLSGLLLDKCPICNTDNPDFALRCKSCGSILQQSVKTLDLFSTIYDLWRYPDFTFRKIILAEHKNYTVFMALLEGIGISYFFMFVVKAGDIYSIDLWRLVVSGVGLAIFIFLPFLYVFSIVSYLTLRTVQTGVTLKGFISATIYGLHPVAFSAIVLLPAEVAVFGAFFSRTTRRLVLLIRCHSIFFVFLISFSFLQRLCSSLNWQSCCSARENL